MDSAELHPLAAPLRRWLREQAWPLWLSHGIDRTHGCFHEHLTPEASCGADFRRLRVVTRQIYVFAAATREGLPGAADAVRLGVDFLRQRAALPEGGYAWRFDLAGRPTDLTRDLYDHAFVLLAWSSAAPLLPEGAALAHALELDRYLQSYFRHPAGGYVESLPEAYPRRQNPHMHLLEAYLAAAEQFQSALFFERASELLELFLERLFQPREGALPEYFDESLTPLRDAGRFMAEPGHHAEWIWLLARHRAIAHRFGTLPPPELEETLAALAKFLELETCRTKTGALPDELWSDGSVRLGTARLWPQTERLKAEVLMPVPNLSRIREAWQVMQDFITGAPPGLWHERWSEQDGYAKMPAPASSLYHLTGGILYNRD